MSNADCVKSVVFVNPVDLGYAATYVMRGWRMAAEARRDLRRCGQLGKLNVVNGSEILLGAPFIFNKDNVTKFDSEPKRHWPNCNVVGILRASTDVLRVFAVTIHSSGRRPLRRSNGLRHERLRRGLRRRQTNLKVVVSTARAPFSPSARRRHAARA